MHNWRKYNGALISDCPPHFEINDSREEILNFLKKVVCILHAGTLILIVQKN